MNSFTREDLWLSLCGLNCGLCPMRIGGYCPGCGGGPGNQPCAVQRCSQKHGGVQYCFQCEAYPCEKYTGADNRDSFITHLHQFRDMDKARSIGLPAYRAEQAEKADILARLLAVYNDGRKKNLFCLAVNLLEMNDLRQVMIKLEEACGGGDVKLRAETAAELMRSAAEARGLCLKLRK